MGNVLWMHCVLFIRIHRGAWEKSGRDGHGSRPAGIRSEEAWISLSNASPLTQTRGTPSLGQRHDTKPPEKSADPARSCFLCAMCLNLFVTCYRCNITVSVPSWVTKGGQSDPAHSSPQPGVLDFSWARIGAQSVARKACCRMVL
jgi:hypothetical protein